jgi:hypothetical protein
METKMNTKFKTLLLTSALAFSLSACAHHNHASNNVPCDKDGKCMVSDRIHGIGEKMENISKEVKALNSDRHDPATKEQLKKIQQELAEVAASVKETQKSVDALAEHKHHHENSGAAHKAAKPADKKAADAHKK